MLRRWLNRSRSTNAGACSIVAVGADRSVSSRPILGVNVDEPLVSVPSRSPLSVGDGVATLAASDHVFLGRNDQGLTVVVVVREEERRRTAMRLGRMVLGCCRRLNQIGDAVRQHWRGSATIVAVDAAHVRGWNIENGTTKLLSVKSGLLLVSAGHSNSDPLPGEGWLIVKLARLESLKRLSVDDVQRSLASARLGDRTSCTIVVGSSGDDRVLRSDEIDAVRKSA